MWFGWVALLPQTPSLHFPSRKLRCLKRQFGADRAMACHGWSRWLGLSVHVHHMAQTANLQSYSPNAWIFRISDFRLKIHGETRGPSLVRVANRKIRKERFANDGKKVMARWESHRTKFQHKILQSCRFLCRKYVEMK